MTEPLKNVRLPGKSRAMLAMLWMKALEKDLRMPCPDRATATALRFKLYAAVSPVRKHPEVNPKLAEVIAQVELALEDDGMTLVLRKSRVANVLDKVLAEAGVVEGRAEWEFLSAGEIPASDEAAEVLESQRRLAELLGKGEGASREVKQPTGFASPYPMRNRGEG